TSGWYAAHMWRSLLGAMRSGSLLGVETDWLDGALCVCIAETAHFVIATLIHINSEYPSAFESAISYWIRPTARPMPIRIINHSTSCSWQEPLHYFALTPISMRRGGPIAVSAFIFWSAEDQSCELHCPLESRKGKHQELRS